MDNGLTLLKESWLFCIDGYTSYGVGLDITGRSEDAITDIQRGRIAGHDVRPVVV